MVVVGDSVDNAKSSEEVLALVLNKTKVAVVIKSPLSGLTKTYSGEGYVTSFSLSTPAGDNATYSYSITGSGTLTPADNTAPQNE